LLQIANIKAIITQFDFNGTELMPTPMDLNATLLNGQHPCSLAKIAKIKNIPGIGPSMHTSKLNIAIMTTMITEILEDPGATHLKAIERDF